MSGYIHDACGVDDGCDACGALRVTPPCVASPCVALRCVSPAQGADEALLCSFVSCGVAG